MFWNYLITDFENPILNLALERKLADEVGEGLALPRLRLWKNGKCFVVGKFGYRKYHTQIKEVIKNGFVVVERQTGGQAIYHDGGCLNFSLFIPRYDKRWNSYKSSKIFHLLSKGVLLTLREMGLNCEQTEVSTFCPGPSDMAINGEKIAGISLARRKNVTVLQGTLIVNSNLKEYIKTIEIFYGELVPTSRGKITSLKNELKREIDEEKLIENIVRNYRNSLCIDFVEENALPYCGIVPGIDINARYQLANYI
jgi:lipoate-protein ligase A